MLEISEPVKTERLVLRPFTAADEEDMLEFESHPEVARYLYNEPRTREENAKELATRQEQTALREEGDTLMLAVELDGKVIGYVLLTWVSEPHKQGEFGYVLHPDHHGRGYASEASVEMLRLGFEKMGMHRVIGRCDAKNDASWRLMERMGMRREAHLREAEIFKGQWGDELHYAMLSREWHSGRSA